MIEEIKKLYCDSDNMQETAQTPSFCIKSFGDYEVPQYTIAIPTFNRVDLLKLAIDSAVNQDDFSDYEILVVDNNPERDDATELLMREYKSNERIAYYKNNKNLGMTGNWNKLYLLARTEWVVMLHDDDMLYPDFMKIMKRTVESDKDASCFYSCYNTFHGEGSEHPSREKHDVRVMTLREADYLTGCHLHAPLGMTLKRNVVFEMGGFNPNYYPSLDFQFHVKLAHYHVVRWLRDYPIASYRWLTNASGKLETLYGWVEKDEAIKWMAFRNTNTHIPEWAYRKYHEYFRYLYMQNWFKSFNGKKEELKKPSVFSHIVYLILKLRLGLPKKLRKHYTIKL